MIGGSERRWRVAALGLGVLAPVAARAQPPAPAYNGTCPNGAPAREAKYCQFIVHYDTMDKPLPTQVGDFLGVTHASDTRTIGLVIAIDQYPGLPGHDISAAAVDAANLQAFLKDEDFDEVIVLRNADASVANINYFLQDYLRLHANDYKGPDGTPRARLVIAYSGHGRAQSDYVDAAFILGSATDPNGSDGIYKMTDFTDNVSKLAPHYFHVLTLVNACFGGNLFGSGNTGAAATPTGPGSFMITAGSPTNEVEALIPRRGSLFFDLIISGITNGDADNSSAGYYLTDGTNTTKGQGSLTLSLPLYNYLSGTFFKINSVQRKADPKFLTLSAPFFGPVQTGMAQGGFFFFSKPPVVVANSMSPYLKPLGPGAAVQTAGIGVPGEPHHQAATIAHHAGRPQTGAVPSARAGGVPATQPYVPVVGAPDTADLPFGPISSIKGRPDIKVFKLPAIYPFKGYDLSSEDKEIDWTVVAKNARPSFIYTRAVGWAGPDTKFADRWGHAKALGVDYGAYIKFDFCSPVQQQLNKLQALTGNDPNALPVAIELVTPSIDQPHGADERACYKDKHMGGGAGAKVRILDLAKAVFAATGRVPLFKGNSNNLSILTDDRAKAYMIWLDAYGAPETLAEKLKLRGSNPWTLWQYSHALTVLGDGKNVTGEVFFGTKDQYDSFRQAKSNVALAAVE